MTIVSCLDGRVRISNSKLPRGDLSWQCFARIILVGATLMSDSATGLRREDLFTTGCFTGLVDIFQQCRRFQSSGRLI